MFTLYRSIYRTSLLPFRPPHKTPHSLNSNRFVAKGRGVVLKGKVINPNPLPPSTPPPLSPRLEQISNDIDPSPLVPFSVKLSTIEGFLKGERIKQMKDRKRPEPGILQGGQATIEVRKRERERVREVICRTNRIETGARYVSGESKNGTEKERLLCVAQTLLSRCSRFCCKTWFLKP